MAAGGTNLGVYNNIASAPIPFPTATNDELDIRLVVQHDHSASRDIQEDSFIQLEEASEAYACVLQKVADTDQSINTSSVTQLVLGNTIYSNDDAFTAGAANTLTVPARPGGGSWTFGLIYAGVRWSSNPTNERQMRIFSDIGAGFVAVKGMADSTVKATTDSFTRQSVVGFVLSPATGDIFKVNLFQNSGAARNVFESEETYFALEMFR